MTEGLIALVILGFLVFPPPYIDGMIPVTHGVMEELREAWLLSWAPVLLAASLGHVLLAGLVAMLALGAARVKPWDKTCARTRQLTAWVAFLVSTVALLRVWPDGPLWLVRLLALSGAANGLFAFLQWAGRVPATQPECAGLRFLLRRLHPDHPNYEGLCGQSNTFGMWQAATLPASLALARVDHHAWLAASAAIGVGLWLSRSRLGALAMAAGALPTVWWLGWMPGPVLLAVGVTAAATIGLYPGGWAWRVLRRSGMSVLFRSDRPRAWRAILQAGFVLPGPISRTGWLWLRLFGRGSRAYDYLCAQLPDRFGRRYNRAHNEWLELYIEHGAVGVALAVGLVVSFLWPAWDVRAYPLSAAALGGMVSLLVSSLGFYPFRMASCLLPTIGLSALLLAGKWG